MMLLTVWWILLINCEVSTSVRKLIERFNWDAIHYDFSTTTELEKAKEAGHFIVGNSIITSIARYGDRMFLATPRLKRGVPSTLNFINTEGEKSPVLSPFPSWEANEFYNGTGKSRTMTSVINVKVDKCSRLWALDNGIAEEMTGKPIKTPAAIFVYHLKNNALIRKHTINEEDFPSGSKLRTIIIDDRVGNCEKAFAYMADSSGGLVVYNWESNLSFRIEHNYFHFDPHWGNLVTSRGRVIQASDGLQALSLTLPRRNGNRNLLFHPTISISEFSVPTLVIQNKTLARHNVTSFLYLGERGPNMQSSASYFDEETGVLLYTTFVKNALNCWSTLWGEELAPDRQGTVDTFDDFAFPADVTVDINGTVWVLTNRLLDFLHEKPDNVVPYHIYSGTVYHVLRGTKCAEE